MRSSAKSVATFIKAKRAEKNLSQVEFSKLIFPQHTSYQFLSNIERGKCQLPPRAINKLSEITGTPNDLIVDLMIEDYKAAIISEVANESKSFTK